MHIQSTRWHVLRAKWNVPSKGRQGGNRKRTGTKPTKIETKTANPETPVAQRLDAISNHLGAMDLVLTNMDSSLNDLNNRGYMDEAMKADIVAAAIEYFTGPGITKEARGKKSWPLFRPSRECEPCINRSLSAQSEGNQYRSGPVFKA